MSFEEKLEELRVKYKELSRVECNSEAYEMLLAELSEMLGIDLERQVDILLNDPDIAQAIEESLKGK